MRKPSVAAIAVETVLVLIALVAISVLLLIAQNDVMRESPQLHTMVLLGLVSLTFLVAHGISRQQDCSRIRVLGAVVAVLWGVAVLFAYVFYSKTQDHLVTSRVDRLSQELKNARLGTSCFVMLISASVQPVIDTIRSLGLWIIAATSSLVIGGMWARLTKKKWIIPVAIAFCFFFIACRAAASGVSAYMILAPYAISIMAMGSALLLMRFQK